MTTIDAVWAVPTMHWLLLAVAGWLMMVSCFVGWHLERSRNERPSPIEVFDALSNRDTDITGRHAA